MNNILKYTILLGAAAGLMTSCIKEEFPTDVVTTDQIGSLSAGMEAAVNSMNAWLTQFNGALESHGDFGYPGICMGLDALTADVACGPDFGYDAEFLRWRAVSTVSADGNAPNFVWKYFYSLNNLANAVLAFIDLENPTEIQKTYAGQALVYRAMAYLYMARVFEYKGTETGAFEGLTVPIVTETTTELEAQNNPRVPHAEMYKFIIEDNLLKAIDLLDGYQREAKNLVDQSVAYGMLARAYLYDGKWAEAEKAARKAIDLSGCRPMTEAEWMNPTTGFNSIDNPAWMWGIIITSDDRVVTSGICNFISFMSPEATYGYVSAGGYKSVKQIDVNLFASIPDTDWRKHSWLDPDRSKYNYQSAALSQAAINSLPDYAPLKFRPAGGDGKNYKVGSAADFPIMRVEEMYLIEAEAAGMQDVARGQQLLVSFVKTHRDPSFVSRATTSAQLQDEVYHQAQIELWGEGHIMFYNKRLNKPQIRGYKGTNHFDGSRYNSPNGTACWTTLPIPTLELNSNSALAAAQNPNPQTLRGTEWIDE